MNLTQAIQSGRHCLIVHSALGYVTHAHVTRRRGQPHFMATDTDVWMPYTDEQDLRDTLAMMEIADVANSDEWEVEEQTA